MTRRVTAGSGRLRTFLLAEAAAFAAAAMVHAGVIVPGYAHGEARIAESAMAAVLLGGLVLTWARPSAARRVGVAAQAFALLGTLVGAFTIAVGVGPRTTPDVVYHALLVVLLIAGLRGTRPSGALA